LRETAESQYDRICAALIAVTVEDGYRNTTPSMVARRAGLTEKDFYSDFKDVEDCLCEVLRTGTEELMLRVLAAYGSKSVWRDRLRAVAYALLEFLEDDPKRARVMTVEVLSAGDRAQLIRDQGMQGLIELIDQGRQELPDPESLTRATAEAVGGSIYNRIHVAIEQGQLDAGDAGELVPPLMYNAVLPYLGAEAAMEELRVARLH
jgi:AcrR family transcriptional regulator